MRLSTTHLYTFPAIRGIQAQREYYVTMCPLRLIPRLFIFDEEELQPEIRAQRVLNKARIPQLVRYMIENPSNYVFSALTVSIDGDVAFEPISPNESDFNMGYIHVPMSARFIINDGQHRRAAIEAAIKLKPELGNESVAIVFFVDTGLRRCQQMFADLNRYAVRTTQSLNILYDYRDPDAQLAREVCMQVPIFAGRTEMEKSTISNRSTKLFTLSGIHKATRELVAHLGPESDVVQQKQIALRYWNLVSLYIPEWQLVMKGQLAPSTFRRDYICAHTVALVALGRLGSALLVAHPDTWPEALPKLRRVDWNRHNGAVWNGRVTMGGRIVNSRNSVLLITGVLKRAVGLPLTADEQQLEDAVGDVAK